MYPDESHPSPNRYVITNPSAEMDLLASDQVQLEPHSITPTHTLDRIQYVRCVLEKNNPVDNVR